MIVIGIAFVPGDRNSAVNLRPRAVDPHQAYYQCIVVAFHTARSHNPDAELHLYTTHEPPQTYSDELAALGVSTIDVPFSYKADPPLAPLFQSSLYTLDVIEFIDRTLSDRSVILIDPDCVVTANLATPVAAVGGQKVGVLDLNLPMDEPSNGLSRRAASRLHAALMESTEAPAIWPHFGGEMYLFGPGSTHNLVSPMREAFDEARASLRSSPECARMSTEEHILNYALRFVELVQLNDYVGRIWTAPTYRHVPPNWRSLFVWHLPAEKDRGFKRLYSVLAGSPGVHLTTRTLARTMGVSRRTPWRFAYDSAARVARSITGP